MNGGNPTNQGAQFPRQFHDIASTIPLKCSKEELKRYLGEPQHVLVGGDLPAAISTKEIPHDTQRYIADHATLRKPKAFTKYRDYALYSIWDRRVTETMFTDAAAEKQREYDPAWYKTSPISDSTVWIYAELERFGDDTFSQFAWIFFFKDDELHLKSRIDPWLSKYFTVQAAPD